MQELDSERHEAEQLRREIQSRDAQAMATQQERQFVSDNVKRLEALVAQRDTELSEAIEQADARSHEAEEARSELARARREHERAMAETTRALIETRAQAQNAQTRVEETVRGKAEADVAETTLRERVRTLEGEIENLRRNVHGLQQESADKEVKLVQLRRRFEQAEEDKLGLNIALDSKQQELELVSTCAFTSDLHTADTDCR